MRRLDDLDDMAHEDLQNGDLVQSRRDHSLGRIVEIETEQVTLEWLDGRRETVAHPRDVGRTDVAWIGRIDRDTSPILLHQLGLDMLGIDSAVMLMYSLDYSSATTCERLADALEEWAFATISKRRCDVVVPSWRQPILAAAGEIRASMGPSDTAIRIRQVASMITRCRASEDQLADDVKAAFDGQAGATLAVEEIAVTTGHDAMAIAREVNVLCHRGDLTRVGDGDRALYRK